MSDTESPVTPLPRPANDPFVTGTDVVHDVLTWDDAQGWLTFHDIDPDGVLNVRIESAVQEKTLSLVVDRYVRNEHGSFFAVRNEDGHAVAARETRRVPLRRFP